MQLFSKLWFLSILSGVAAFASTVWGETGPLSLEAVECQGNQRTSCEYIQNKLGLKEGDVLKDEALKDSKLKLELLGLFEEVDLRLGRGSVPGKVKLTVGVREQSSFSVNPTVGVVRMKTTNFSVLDLTAVDRNLTGHGDSLTLRFRGLRSSESLFGEELHAHQGILRAEYARELLYPGRFFYVVGATYSNFDSDFYRGERAHYFFPEQAPTIQAFSADASVGKRIFDYSYISLGLRDRLLSPYETFTYSASRPDLFLQYGWDSRNDPLFPTQGSVFNIFGELGYVASGFGGRSLDFISSFIKYWEPATDHVISLRLGAQDFTSNQSGIHQEEDEGLGLRYTYLLHPGKKFAERASLYVEGGGFGSSEIHGVGAKLGSAIQTKYGTLNLFFLASYDKWGLHL